MSHVEVVARMKIRPGQLEAFKVQAAELLRLTREKDTQTLRYDSFINETAMEREVHEAYLNEQGFMEHNQQTSWRQERSSSMSTRLTTAFTCSARSRHN